MKNFIKFVSSMNPIDYTCGNSDEKIPTISDWKGTSQLIFMKNNLCLSPLQRTSLGTHKLISTYLLLFKLVCKIHFPDNHLLPHRALPNLARGVSKMILLFGKVRNCKEPNLHWVIYLGDVMVYQNFLYENMTATHFQRLQNYMKTAQSILNIF